MKTIAIILFATLFISSCTTYMYPDWHVTTDIDRMMDRKTNSFFVRSKDFNNDKIALLFICREDGIWPTLASYTKSFGKEYQNEGSEILIRFEKEPAYNIYIYYQSDSIIHFTGEEILTDESSMLEWYKSIGLFLSKMKKHQTLLIKIQIQSDDSDEYIIAEFDISRFNETVEKHCG